jgi:hypothetical protein
MRGAHRILVAGCACALVALLESACVRDFQCEPVGESCAGNMLRRCWASSAQPEDHDCGRGRCVEDYRPFSGQRYAACSFQGSDRRCDANAEDGSYCRGETIVACHGAYPQGEFDCTTLGLVCETTRTQFPISVNTDIAACVKSHDVEPRCKEKGSRTPAFCDGDRLVQCFGEHRRETSCLDLGRHCREQPGRLTMCLFGEAPDPRCIAGASVTFCDGDTAVRCEGVYRAAQADCTRAGRRCLAGGGHVRCE